MLTLPARGLEQRRKLVGCAALPADLEPQLPGGLRHHRSGDPFQTSLEDRQLLRCDEERAGPAPIDDVSAVVEEEPLEGAPRLGVSSREAIRQVVPGFVSAEVRMNPDWSNRDIYSLRIGRSRRRLVGRELREAEGVGEGEAQEREPPFPQAPRERLPIRLEGSVTRMREAQGRCILPQAPQVAIPMKALPTLDADRREDRGPVKRPGPKVEACCQGGASEAGGAPEVALRCLRVASAAREGSEFGRPAGLRAGLDLDRDSIP